LIFKFFLVSFKRNEEGEKKKIMEMRIFCRLSFNFK